MNKIDNGTIYRSITNVGSDLIEEAFEPMERERKNNIIWLKRVGTVAASLAVAAAVLFSVNLVFPAFAEELPLVGVIFRQFNSFGSHAGTYENVVQPINKSEAADRYTLTASEAYSDGEYLFFTLQLETDDPQLEEMYHFHPWSLGSDPEGAAAGYTLSVNGAVAFLTDEITLLREHDFTAVLSAHLPEEVRNSGELHVKLILDPMRGETEEFIANTVWSSTQYVFSDRPVELSFDVTPNTAYNREDPAANVTVNSVTLRSWKSSPSRISAVFSYPYFGTSAGACVEARTESGEDLGEAHDDDFVPAPWPDDAGFGDTVSIDYNFKGVTSQTEKVIFTVFNHYTDMYEDYVDGRRVGPAVFAEFTVDLKNGTVVPSETYLSRQYRSVDILEYAAVMEKGPEYKDHIFVQPSDLVSRIDSPDGTETAFCQSFVFYSDSEEELPLQVVFSLDGREYASVETGDISGAQPVNDHGSEYRYAAGDNYQAWLHLDRFGVGWFNVSAKRTYTINAYHPDVHPAPDDVDFGAAHNARVQIKNTETGEVLYDSSAQPPALYPIPEN